MDPSQLITSLEILSRLSLFQSLYFSGKNCPYIIFDKKYINRLPSDSILGPFSPRKMFHFWTFCPRKICHFWTQKYIANLFKKFILLKVGLESTENKREMPSNRT